MTFQQGQDFIIALKAQSGLGSPASGASGLGLRVTRGSQGFRQPRPYIESNESRRDGMTTKGRLGTRSAPGSYDAELSVDNTLLTLFEAGLRGTWTAASDITQATATLTSIITGTDTIQAGGGSWITAGVRLGDMVKLSGHSTAANNNIWLPVLGLTTLTITTFANALTSNAVADTAFTMTIARNLIQGTTERYFTYDEYSGSVLDVSMTYEDAKVNRLELILQPDSIALVRLGMLGRKGVSNATGSSPVLTSPTFGTATPLTVLEGAIYSGVTPLVDLTGLSFALDLGGVAPSVLAVNAPDVFLNNARLTGQLSGLRSDLSRFAAFDAETQLSIFIRCSENESDPKDFISFFIGNAMYSGPPDGAIGADGPFVESLPIMAGKDEAGGARSATMLKVCTSAA